MKPTYTTAMAAGQDAGNRHAAKHGRKVWTFADWNVAAETVARLYAPPVDLDRSEWSETPH